MKSMDEINLRLKQLLVDIEYKKNGLTDDVLTKQIAINKKRHELDIPDSKEKIYDKYVQ